MTGVEKYFLQNSKDSKGKDIELKRRIIARLSTGDHSIADIAKAINISIPTITKAILELIADNIVEDLGKVETTGGRRPNIFGLKDTDVHFLGAEARFGTIAMVVTDLRGHVVASQIKSGDALEIIEEFAREHNVFATGVCVNGRVNPYKGKSEEASLTKQQVVERLKMPVHFDSILRARCRAAQLDPEIGALTDFIYADIERILSIVLVAGGKIYYGHNGLAGGLYDGLIITPGKTIDKILFDASKNDQNALEEIESAARSTGQDLSAAINMLNPQAIVAGGEMGRAGDEFLLPLHASIHRYTPRALYSGMLFFSAEQDEYTAATGVAAMIREITLGLK